MKIKIIILFLVWLSIFLGVLNTNGQPIKNVDPGKYIDWNNAINELEIYQKFRLTNYSQLIIIPLETSKTILDMDDNTLEDFKKKMNEFIEIFIRGVHKGLKGKLVVTRGEKGKNYSPDSLIFSGRAHKIFAGHIRTSGLNRTSVQIRGELIDGKSNQVLLSLKNRRSSTIWGSGESKKYSDFIEIDIVDLGEDLGDLLREFQE